MNEDHGRSGARGRTRGGRLPGGWALLAAATLSAPLSAQANSEVTRRPLAGIVLDADGGLVAGATVTLAGATASPVWDAEPDVLTTTTDDRGRFRVEVLDCVEYSAWASTSTKVSMLAAGLVPGPRHELRLTFDPPQPLSLLGLDEWRDLRPLRARLRLAGGSDLCRDVEVVDDAVQIPPDWPFAAFELELLDADGNLRFSQRAGTHTKGLQMPKPRTIDVVVEGPDRKPLAGAAVWVDARAHELLVGIGATARRARLVVGITDAEGRCAARIGTRWIGDDPRRGVSLHVSKPGHADGYGGWDHENRVFSAGFAGAGDDGPLTAAGALRLRLRPERPLAGRLTVGGRPVAGCEVRVSTQREVRVEAANIGYLVAGEVRAMTDAEGRFVLRGLGGEAIERVQVATHPGVWGDDPPRVAAPGQPLFAVTRDSERLDLDTSTCCRVAVQALTVDAGPVSSAVLLVLPLLGEADYLDADDPRYRLDPAGRTTLLLQRDVDWLLFAIDGTRVAQAVVRPGPTAEEVELRLAELPRLRVRVVDAGSKPVAGARFGYQRYSYRRAPAAADRQLTMLAIQLYQRWFGQQRSDAEGLLELPMFEPDWTDFEVTVRAGEGQSVPWRLRRAEETIEVTVK